MKLSTTAILIAPFALSIALGLSSPSVTNIATPDQVYNGLDAHETSSGASLLGQFRTSLSSYLWLQSDLYLHNGVQMRKLDEQEIQSGVSGVGGEENGESGSLHDDAKIVTVIPDAHRDFRGVFGQVEREVSAYKDMSGHKHNDPEQALPLFRLMTWLDPQFVPGWTVGASIILRSNSEESLAKALSYLRSGLRANPNSLSLNAEIGRILIARANRLEDSLPHLEAAVNLGTPNFEQLSENDREALQLAYRMLVLANRDLFRRKLAFQYASQGLKLYPDDAILLRTINPAPSILTPEYAEQYRKMVGLGEEASLTKLLSEPKSEQCGDDCEQDHAHDHQ